MICPRCAMECEQPFYGPCISCRVLLNQGKDTAWFRDWDVKRREELGLTDGD